MNENRTAPAVQSESSRSRQFRWKPMAGILLFGLGGELAVLLAFPGDHTRQVFFSMPILSLTALLLILWWLFLSRLTWRTRLLGVGVLAAFGFGLTRLFRVDGFTGEMLPIISYRIQPTAEERAEQFWKSHGVPTDAVSNVPTGLNDEDLQPVTLRDGDWPAFCGANRDGIIHDAGIRRDWDTLKPACLWRHPVGLSWSSFSVVDGKAFTQEQRGQNEAVVCYDFQTGRELWSHVDPTRFSEAMGGDGPRATPTIHDSRLYALGATGLLNCLEAATGRLLWRADLVKDTGASVPHWGFSGSPLVHQDDVIVIAGRPKHTVVGYDRRTGAMRWHGGDRSAGYASPQLVQIDGRLQLLVFGGDGLSGHEVDTGRELWFFKWPNSEKINVTQPVVIDSEAILIGAGYGKGCALLNIVKNAGTWAIDESPRWTSRRLRPKFNHVVVHDGFVFGLDEGILTCLDLKTGERRWKGGRYGYGQILLVDDQLLIMAESGEVVLVEATLEGHQEITRFQAIEGKTWNHPVLIRGHLLVRNGAEAACYDIASR